MTKPILIVGGGPAGLAAAHALAGIGHTSVLVEKTQILGGAPIQSGYAKLVPSGMWAKDVVRKGRTVTFTEDLPDHALDESPGERWYSRAEMVGYYGSPPEGPVATLDGRRTPRSY